MLVANYFATKIACMKVSPLCTCNVCRLDSSY